MGFVFKMAYIGLMVFHYDDYYDDYFMIILMAIHVYKSILDIKVVLIILIFREQVPTKDYRHIICDE